jgi:hypothetical protein
MAGSAGMLGGAAGEAAMAGVLSGAGQDEDPSAGSIPMLQGEPGGWERLEEELRQRSFVPLRSKAPVEEQALDPPGTREGDEGATDGR